MKRKIIIALYYFTGYAYHSFIFLFRIVNAIWKWIESSLIDNKDLLQVLSAILLGVASVYVAHNSYEVSNTQLAIRKAELYPEFNIKWRRFPDSASIIKAQIDVYKTKGYATGIVGSTYTYLVISKGCDPITVDTLPAKTLVFPIDYFESFQNLIGTQGKVSFYTSVDLNRLEFASRINYTSDTGVVLYSTRWRGNKRYGYSINLITIVNLTYTNVVGQREEQFFSANDGGYQISKEFFNENFTDKAVMPKITISKNDLTLHRIDSLLDNLKE